MYLTWYLYCAMEPFSSWTGTRQIWNFNPDIRSFRKCVCPELSSQHIKQFLHVWHSDRSTCCGQNALAVKMSRERERERFIYLVMGHIQIYGQTGPVNWYMAKFTGTYMLVNGQLSWIPLHLFRLFIEMLLHVWNFRLCHSHSPCIC